MCLMKRRIRCKAGNALASGKNQASSGIGQAESQISIKSEELKQAQLEITEKMAELNVSETQLNQSYAVVKAGRSGDLSWRVWKIQKKVMIRQLPVWKN